jgi:hypothetical protein
MKRNNLTEDLKKKLKKMAKDEQAHSMQSAIHLLSELDSAKDISEKVNRIQAALMAFHAAIIFKNKK